MKKQKVMREARNLYDNGQDWETEYFCKRKTPENSTFPRVLVFRITQ